MPRDPDLIVNPHRRNRRSAGTLFQRFLLIGFAGGVYADRTHQSWTIDFGSAPRHPGSKTTIVIGNRIDPN